MTIDALHAWHVAMRGLLLSPSPVRIVYSTAAVHRRAEMGEQSVSVVGLRTAALPPSALHRLCPFALAAPNT
jgi:hypothetical protein